MKCKDGEFDRLTEDDLYRMAIDIRKKMGLSDKHEDKEGVGEWAYWTYKDIKKGKYRNMKEVKQEIIDLAKQDKEANRF